MPLKTSGISQTPYTTQCTHPETHLPTDEPQQPTPESTLPNTVPPTKQLNKQGAISLKLLHYSCSCRLKKKKLKLHLLQEGNNLLISIAF